MSKPPCAVEGCVRGDGEDWPQGPSMCVPHRRQWAADHEYDISAEEWARWANEHAYDDKWFGVTLSTWPLNFRSDSGKDMRWAAFEAERGRQLKLKVVS